MMIRFEISQTIVIFLLISGCYKYSAAFLSPQSSSLQILGSPLRSSGDFRKKIRTHQYSQNISSSDLNVIVSLPANNTIYIDESIRYSSGNLSESKNTIRKFIKKTRKNSETKALDVKDEPITPERENVDSMVARAAVLRRSILSKQMELQKLERQIICCADSRLSSMSLSDDYIPDEIMNELFIKRTVNTFVESLNVLFRKMYRVNQKIGPNNAKWDSVGDYVVTQTKSGVRILDNLVRNPRKLTFLVDKQTPTLIPHAPAIIARLDRLEGHVDPILERVLNNREHLPSIEPYLEDILERFDDIEPHLPWVLDNIDALAPYTGLLLKHMDELLLFAEVNDYSLAEELLPYLEFYVSRLDTVGPHLPLLRPHVPLLLRKNLIPKISPHIDKLFIRGYKDLYASANLDVLVFWFGWALKVPGLAALFFALPFSPRIISFLAKRLPKRFVRGYCNGVTCDVEGLSYGPSWNKSTKGLEV